MEVSGNGAILGTEVEVVAKAERRRFTAEYKLKVLREADHCQQSGEIGALLRREGLYGSNLITWRKQRERGELAGLSARKRGPKRREKNPLTERVRELERETCWRWIRLCPGWRSPRGRIRMMSRLVNSTWWEDRQIDPHMQRRASMAELIG